MINKFPRWKYGLLIVVFMISVIYSLPNLYGEDPAVQITGLNEQEVSETIVQKITDNLAKEAIDYKSVALTDKTALIRFFGTETQLKAKDRIKSWLGEDYSVAVNLAPVTPKWLMMLGANPMKLGLDLRGGVRFVMEVDVASNVKRHLEGDFTEIRNGLRKENIRYLKFVLDKGQTLSASFASKTKRNKAYSYISAYFPQFDLVRVENNGEYGLEMRLTARQLIEIKNYTIEQTMTTLRNRINELGVAEPVVQQQGIN